MQIKEIMSKKVTFVTPETTIDEVAQKMRDNEAGAVLVGSNDKFVGFITDHDLAKKVIADGREPQAVKADEVMTHPVLYCFEDQEAEEVADNMIEQHVLRMLVVDRSKRAKGVVAHSDFADAVVKRDMYDDTLAKKVVKLACKKAA